MTLQNLKAKLYADSVLSAKSNDEILATLNTPIVTVVPSLYTDKMLVRDLEATLALTLLGTVTAIANSNSPEAPLFQRVDQWLKGTGIDLGLAKTRDMIDSFISEQLLTSDQGQAVKALAEVQSYPQGGPCTLDDIVLAKASNEADAVALSIENQIQQKLFTARQRLATYQSVILSGGSQDVPTIESVWV
jgi:hypothetical protein